MTALETHAIHGRIWNMAKTDKVHKRNKREQKKVGSATAGEGGSGFLNNLPEDFPPN